MKNNQKNQDLNKKINKEDLELKIYRMLGVEQFRKLVFLLEKAIHFKDKGKNINYHIKNNIYGSAEDFKKYLYYNGAIHVRNAIFLFLLLIVKFMFFKTSVIFDIGLLLNLTKDLYCIMLQRYNYIRINKFIKLRERRNNSRIETSVLKVERAIAKKAIDLSLTCEDKEKDLELINKMKHYLLNFNNICLEGDSIENLRRIKDFLALYIQTINFNNSGVAKNIMSNNETQKGEGRTL